MLPNFAAVRNVNLWTASGDRITIVRWWHWWTDLNGNSRRLLWAGYIISHLSCAVASVIMSAWRVTKYSAVCWVVRPCGSERACFRVKYRLHLHGGRINQTQFVFCFTGILFCLPFDPGDGGDMFLRIFSLSPNYVAYILEGHVRLSHCRKDVRFLHNV
jgi:hypothetical protein